MLGVRKERGKERWRHTFRLVDVVAQANEDVHFGVSHFGLPCLYHYCWVTPFVLAICEKHIDLEKYIQSSNETSCRNAEHYRRTEMEMQLPRFKREPRWKCNGRDLYTCSFHQ